MPYIYSRPYVYSFCQVFQALRLFPALCLFRTLEYVLCFELMHNLKFNSFMLFTHYIVVGWCSACTVLVLQYKSKALCTLQYGGVVENTAQKSGKLLKGN